MQYSSGENLRFRRCREVAANVRMVFHCEIIFTGINRYSLLSKGESLKMKKQIASGFSEMVHSSTSLSSEWRSINWKKAWREVKRLQMCIAKAVKEEDYGRVKSLQIDFNALVLRQGFGCETGDLK